VPEPAVSREPLVDPAVLKKSSGYPEYIEAKLGFRNHWYPTLFSHELAEGEFMAHRLLSDRILLARVDGRVYAVRDRCLHRGVPFSRKIECYKKGTVTCWYHGFTYLLESGELCDIITSPRSNMIGRAKIAAWPVQEAQGLIFVFMGDGEPPDLADDVPPGFLADNLAVYGQRQEVGSNWRIGVENGFDSTHVFIHKESVLVEGNDLMLPLGFVPTSKDTFEVVDGPQGPKGVLDHLAEHCEPVFDGKVQGDTVLHGHMGATRVAYNISIWLPGVLRVMPWPHPGITQYEWYVPIDERRHYYIQTLGKEVSNDTERQAFAEEFANKWLGLALKGFNDDDVWAREAQQEFYENDEAWLVERLFEPDRNISRWRLLASRRNRGIQRPEHLL
jgi:carbazole 1,9a-dioxygenase terminal dioxygenase component